MVGASYRLLLVPLIFAQPQLRYIMSKPYYTDEIYSDIRFDEKPIAIGQYENCEFNRCDFGGANLSHFLFTDCRFTHCNLSNVNLNMTTLNNVHFMYCKLTGTSFEPCNTFLFSVSFEHCLLELASFYKRVLRKTNFLHCQMNDTDFTEADLSQSVFADCDLTDAHFENTNLEKADLRTAHNYRIDPDNNRIRKARFALPDVLRLLEKYDISID